MTLNDRVTELEKKFMNLQEYVIDLLKIKRSRQQLKILKLLNATSQIVNSSSMNLITICKNGVQWIILFRNNS